MSRNMNPNTNSDTNSDTNTNTRSGNNKGFSSSNGMKRFGNCVYGGTMYFLNAPSLQYCHEMNVTDTERNARCKELDMRMTSYISTIMNNCGRKTGEKERKE